MTSFYINYTLTLHGQVQTIGLQVELLQASYLTEMNERTHLMNLKFSVRQHEYFFRSDGLMNNELQRKKFSAYQPFQEIQPRNPHLSSDPKTNPQGFYHLATDFLTRNS